MGYTSYPVSPDGLPLQPALDHIARHFIGSGTLGANIGRWRDSNSLFSNPAVRAFLFRVATQLDPACTGIQKFHLALPFAVGYEGIVRKDALVDWRIWPENREGFEVSVTNAPLVETEQLNFILVRKPDYWLILSVWAGTNDSPSLNNTEWWKDWAFYNNR